MKYGRAYKLTGVLFLLNSMRLYSIIFCISFSYFLSARTLNVGKNFTFQKLSLAFKAASAGDTILIHSGQYSEGNLIIDKPISLIGIGWPVLDGEKKVEILSVKASNVLISGLVVKGSNYASLEDPAAIKVYDASHVNIIGNKLEDNFFGIYLQYSKKCVIRGNKIRAYGKDEQMIGNGIHCWKSDSLQIIGNEICGHRDGIYFEFVTHSVIWRNRSHNNIRYGLHFMFSNDDAYISNVFRENGSGVAVMFTKRVLMINNHFVENWGDASYGLLLKEISDCNILNNYFNKNTAGIYLEGVSRADIVENTFDDNGWGMKIQASCMDNRILQNDFKGNTFDVSTNGDLVLNTFENNYWQKYEGYDLNKDGFGDIPFHPLSLYSKIAENNPSAMMLYRSFIVMLMDRTEKVMPSITPDNFIDEKPRMKPVYL